jgi:hypothetical protein
MCPRDRDAGADVLEAEAARLRQLATAAEARLRTVRPRTA